MKSLNGTVVRSSIWSSGQWGDEGSPSAECEWCKHVERLHGCENKGDGGFFFFHLALHLEPPFHPHLPILLTSRRWGQKAESQVVRHLPHHPSIARQIVIEASSSSIQVLYLELPIHSLPSILLTSRRWGQKTRVPSGSPSPSSPVQFARQIHFFTSRCFHSREAFPRADTIHTPQRNLLLHPPLSTTPDGGFFFFHLSSSS
ncbi:hypothetical protein CEXT_97981 [Caerostris extrusa]|uniref:Uncharacterized protein n=1 Tax=Caerostris extrusa TaxID=172846 RepID=A0AAV4U8L9_CAEEX|nr:hypothetical protein CEXT_97981 [Caerostris extrusa]